MCAILAAATPLGPVVFSAFGWWQADPITALAVSYFAVREGREACHGADLRRLRPSLTSRRTGGEELQPRPPSD
jgi:hypothetical protein